MMDTLRIVSIVIFLWVVTGPLLLFLCIGLYQFLVWILQSIILQALGDFKNAFVNWCCRSDKKTTQKDVGHESHDNELYILAIHSAAASTNFAAAGGGDDKENGGPKGAEEQEV